MRSVLLSVVLAAGALGLALATPAQGRADEMRRPAFTSGNTVQVAWHGHGFYPGYGFYRGYYPGFYRGYYRYYPGFYRGYYPGFYHRYYYGGFYPWGGYYAPGYYW